MHAGNVWFVVNVCGKERSKKIRGQVTWCLILLGLTNGVASLAVQCHLFSEQTAV
jgi:hypothetical protein